jgi:hypothetical protein
MTAVSIVVIYVIIGCGAAIAIVVQERAPAKALLMLALWPFLLPARLAADPAGAVTGTARARRLEAVARSLSEAWDRSGRAATRERAVIDAFIEKLKRSETRLVELESAIATAAPSIRPKLEKLKESTAGEIDAGVAILDEIVAQLTLLRFAGLASREGAAHERDHVEGLLARIEAMATLS